MRSLVISVGMVLCVTNSLGFVQSCFGQARSKFFDIENSNNSEVKALEAGIDAWRRSVDFVVDYTYESGFAKSVEEAWDASWIIDESLELGVRNAKGRIVKFGTALRFSAMFEDGTDVDPETGVAHFASEDIIQTDEMQIKYWPSQSSIRESPPKKRLGRVKFLRTDSIGVGGSDRKILMTPLPFFVPNSFFTVGGNDGHLLSHIDVRSENGETLDFSVDKSDVQTRVLIDVRMSQGQQKRKYLFIFNGKSTIPCLQEYRFEMFDAEGQLTQLHHRKLKDFVDCGNGCLVAGRFSEVAGPFKNKSGEHGEVYVGRHWVGENLGERRPEKGDFDLEIPAGILWLQYKPNHHKEIEKTSTVNPFDIDVDDIIVIERYDPSSSGLDMNSKSGPCSSSSNSP